MRRINTITLNSLLLLSCCAAWADGSMFVFPHTDQNQPTEAPTTLSFGTLMEATPPGLQELQTIPDRFLHSYMAPDHPIRILLEDGFATRAGELAFKQLAALESQADSQQAPMADAISRARLNLGVALYADGHPRRALPLLKQSLNHLRRRDDWFGQRWLGPLLALGMSQQQLALHDDADRSLARAQHLIQRHFGAQDPQQLPLLLARATSLDARDEPFKTEQLYRTHLKLVKKQDSPHSTRRLAATHILAEWLVENGQYRKAISVFNTLMDAQQAAPRDDHQPTVELATLTALAQIYLRQGELEADRGLRLALQATELVTRYPTSFEPLEQVQAHLFAGDWLTLFGRRGDAAKSYALAWRAAARSPGGDNLQRQLEIPVMIFDGPEVPLPDMGYQWANQHAYANFRMSIKADGRPARVHLTDTNMHRTTIRLAQQLMRKARFRPAIVNGKPVAVAALRHNRIYNTEPFEGFGRTMVGGLAARDLDPR